MVSWGVAVRRREGSAVMGGDRLAFGSLDWAATDYGIGDGWIISLRLFRIVVLISGGGTTLRNLNEKIAWPTAGGDRVGHLEQPDGAGTQLATETGMQCAVVERKVSPIKSV